MNDGLLCVAELFFFFFKIKDQGSSDLENALSWVAKTNKLIQRLLNISSFFFPPQNEIREMEYVYDYLNIGEAKSQSVTPCLPRQTGREQIEYQNRALRSHSCTGPRNRTVSLSKMSSHVRFPEALPAPRRWRGMNNMLTSTSTVCSRAQARNKSEANKRATTVVLRKIIHLPEKE